MNQTIFKTSRQELNFNENCIYIGNSNNAEINSKILLLGNAISNTLNENNKSKIGILYDSTSESVITAKLLLNIFSSHGIANYNFGSNCEILAKHFSMEFFTDYFIFIFSKKSDLFLKIYDSNGEYISNSTEKKIEKNLKYDTLIPILKKDYSHTIDLFHSELFYKQNLIKRIHNEFECTRPLDGISIIHKETEHTSFSMLFEILTELGAVKNSDTNKNSVRISISEAGTEATVIFPGKIKYDSFHILALLNIHDLIINRNKKDLPFFFKYFNNKITNSTPIYKNAGNNEDMCYSVARFLSLYNLKNELFIEARNSIPTFEITKNDIDSNSVIKNKAKIIKKLRQSYLENISEENDGIDIILKTGVVKIIPKNIAGFKLITSAASIEAASELSEKITSKIKEYAETL